MDSIKHRDIGMATFGRWDFGLFRKCLSNFFFGDEFFGSFRRLKDISKITFRSYETTGTKCFQNGGDKFLSLRSETNTCNRLDCWLFRWHHRHFLFRDNFRSFRHLKDISKVTFRSYETTGAKYFQEQKSHIFLNLRGSTSTCNRRGFWLFKRHHRYFLFRDNFFGSLRHLKDISKIVFKSYKTTNRIFSRTEELHLVKPKISDKYLEQVRLLAF